MVTTKEILVLFYSKNGATKSLANLVARGIESVDGVSARIRTVPEVQSVYAHNKTKIDTQSDAVYVTREDLTECSGLALGSPVRYGNIASALRYFWEGTTYEWLTGVLSGKPACVFTSSGSMHGGQESCLLSMMLPLLHHGMLLVGLPYTDSELMNTTSGGTPYGVSHVAGMDDNLQISSSERKLAIYQGRRMAEIVLKLDC